MLFGAIERGIEEEGSTVFGRHFNIGSGCPWAKVFPSDQKGLEGFGRGPVLVDRLVFLARWRGPCCATPLARITLFLFCASLCLSHT